MKTQLSLLFIFLSSCFCSYQCDGANSRDYCNDDAAVNDLSFILPPENDVCTGATDLGVIECDFFEQFFDDPEATGDAEATGNCIDPSEPGQWYTFTTPDPIPYGTFFFGASWINIEIFKTDTDCDALQYVECGSGAWGFNPEPDTKYYFLTTGGFLMTTPHFIPTSCEDFLFNIDFSWANPYTVNSSTDCAESSSVVPCENDHVIWYSYTTGCHETDLLFEAEPYDGMWFTSAKEVSITVLLDDCSTLASEYDVAGLGYLCSTFSGETISLEDIPPGTSLHIAFGSAINNMGYFNYTITETTEGDNAANDICSDAFELIDGINQDLTNLCSSFTGGIQDPPLQGCGTDSEATVWYTYDPGPVAQDITINLNATGIVNPAIVVYEGCSWTTIMTSCDGNVDLECIDEVIKIQVISLIDDAGNFELDITSTPSPAPLGSEITGDNICSSETTDIIINMPEGQNVNIDVDISPNSSTFISGMNNHTFSGTSSGAINDILVNTSITVQEAIYSVNIESGLGGCPIEPIEYSILVYPRFVINDINIEECLPYQLTLDIQDVIERGTAPYGTVNWYWNAASLIGSGDLLTYDLIESGEITVEVVDAVGCESSATFNVDVSNSVEPEFDFPIQYCRSDQNFIYFPNNSLEGISGSWSPSDFDLEFTEDGFYDVVFTPDDPECTLPTQVMIEIYSGYTPEFDLPSLICSSQGEYVFPTVDLNGVSGNWDDPSVDVSTISGTQTNSFTPSNTNCFAVYEYIFEISDNLDVSFGQPDSLCNNESPITLNDISNDGYAGSWNDPLIDPSLITEDSVIRIWTPAPGQSPCIEETEVVIYILEPVMPEFNLPDELCTYDPLFTFPDIDNQLFTGSWSIPTLQPSVITGSIASIFTPDDDCIESFEWEVKIVEPLIPSFSIDTALCSLDGEITLPLVSENGISGEWTIPIIDPQSSSGQTIMVEFIGTSTDTCIETIEVIFEVVPATTPDFDLPGAVCWLESDISLPTNSLNGVEGVWTPATIDIQAFLGGVANSTFTSSDGICALDITYFVDIIEPYSIELSVTDPSDCMIDDGTILIDAGLTENLEYSLDGGDNWQSSTMFSALSAGGYTVSIRSTLYEDCILEEATFLNAADAPIINEVMSVDVGSCIVENGSIQIDAEGNNLEYSIDGGITWQTSNEFADLPSGEYMINIREEASDCIVETLATIDDIIPTEIIMLNTLDITDCNANNGRIEIIATGESLEYSIDNGANWSMDNLFENLPDGNYMIIVQSSVFQDCVIASEATLSAPTSPEILNIFVQQPTVCSINTGRIEIDAAGENLEYSFDGGLTWQLDNFTENVMAGNYNLIVRDSDKVQCYVDEVRVIEEDPESLEESMFTLTSPTDCDLADGAIDVGNIISDLEYSIDGGLNWQITNIFNNLPSGNYTVITRLVALPDCFVEQSIELPDVDCDCQDLVVSFEIENVPCENVASASIELTSIAGMEDMDIEILWMDGTEGTLLTELGEGWYSYIINYDGQCIWNDSVYVEQFEAITFEWIIKDEDCPALGNGSIEITNVRGGTGNYEYSIDENTFGEENVFPNLVGGIYEVMVQDDGNCISVETIEVLTPVNIEFELPEIVSITNGDAVTLDPGVDITLIDSFSWSPLDGIIDPNALVIEVLPELSTSYTLEIFYDECYDTRSVLVEVEKEETGIYFGNIFSPNDDDINDVFFVQGRLNSKTTLNDMRIYDRWGNKIFGKINPRINVAEDGWDGYMNGQKMNSGVYVYSILYTESGVDKVEMGTITLVY